MSAKKPSLLVVINPNASRTEEALATLTEWFAENYADGRLATATPAEFTLRHKSLKVIVPRKRPKNHRGLAWRARASRARSLALRG